MTIPASQAGTSVTVYVQSNGAGGQAFYAAPMLQQQGSPNSNTAQVQVPAMPAITNFAPRAVGIGSSSVPFTITGAGFGTGTPGLSFGSSGITNVVITGNSSVSVTGTFDVPATSAPGQYTVALTPSGSTQSASTDIVVVDLPAVLGPGGAADVSFWYLGGAPSIDGFYVQSALTLTTNSTNPSPVIVWTTDSPSRLDIVPNANRTSAVLTSKGASAFPGNIFDIHVTVTVDGVASRPFPIFINTPFTMTTSIDTANFHCADSAVGYLIAVGHGLFAVDGEPISRITINESLEGFQYLAPHNGLNTNWITRYIAKGGWNTQDDWAGGMFTDSIQACPTSSSPLDPPPQNYSAAGTDKIWNVTQKFWAGSATNFAGACVQLDVITEYLDHGTLTLLQTPIVNQSDCRQGNTINPNN